MKNSEDKEEKKFLKQKISGLESRKLEALRPLWDFLEKIELDKENRDFFFDLSELEEADDWLSNSLSLDDLHKQVLSDILNHNIQYLKAREQDNTEEPIEEKEYLKQLSPIEELDEKDKYNYEFLVRLGIRQKLEDDFNLDIAELNLWTQRNFLQYLERCNVEETQRLQGFVKEYGKEGLETFLSIDLDSKAVEKIFNIDEAYNKETAQDIFSKYSSVINKIEESEQELIEFFSDKKEYDDIDKTKLTKELLKRAHSIIEEFAEENYNRGEAENKLENLQDDVIIFTSIFKTAFKGEEEIDFESVRGLDFETQKVDKISEEDKE
ncbi:MAG: hypothetical protein BRC22_00655, partial [Parcubacteria group bacterium QH_9_35_7]